MSESTGEPIHTDDLDFLIEQYIAGRLNEAEGALLLSRLEREPTAGSRLIDQLHMDAMLREVASDDALKLPALTEPAARFIQAPLQPTPQADATRRRWRLPRALVVGSLAACVVAAISAALLLRQSSRQITAVPPTVTGTQPIEATTSAVAVLTRTVDARWRDASSGPRIGSALPPGWLRLDSGLAEVEFFNGAQVVLEGPVELQLVSAVEAYCESGKLRAEVPPQARGFRIVTPQINVVDRGTAFGIDVSAGSAQVHVFKGLVELHDKAAAVETSSHRDLTEGQAATIDMGGVIRDVPADSTAFVTTADVNRRLNESQQRWSAKWLAAGQRTNADPSLLVRFDFENASSGERMLRNVAESRVAADAAIVGSGWSEGRWPGKGALEFRGVGDRVRLEVPGSFDSITYTVWVRVHGTDRYFNSIFMSDAFGAGATHWQILRNGKVRLGIGTGQPMDSDSPVVFTPERLGQWVHLAVVYDAARRQVTHFVDGRPASTTPIQSARPIVIGRVELGNWNPAPRGDATPIRHFSGRIDEFAAFGRALSEREIAEMYAIGGGLMETAGTAQE